MRLIRHLKHLPISLKIALGATCVVFLLNVEWALSLDSHKIDPGTATLFGAIIGLTIIGQQAKKGFANLIKSQRNQAELDRDARLHAAELEQSAEETKRKNGREVLMAAMWAEAVTVWQHVANAENVSRAFGLMHEAFQKQRMPVIASTRIVFETINAPVFTANISNLGLLGSSLAADVVSVLSRANGNGANVDASAMTHDMIHKLYVAHTESLKHWRQDLFHVSMRINALLHGLPDPGSLKATENERRQGD
jgi:murein L,D-transpeptidase YcbB/YkuD